MVQNRTFPSLQRRGPAALPIPGMRPLLAQTLTQPLATSASLVSIPIRTDGIGTTVLLDGPQFVLGHVGPGPGATSTSYNPACLLS